MAAAAASPPEEEDVDEGGDGDDAGQDAQAEQKVRALQMRAWPSCCGARLARRRLTRTRAANV